MNCTHKWLDLADIFNDGSLDGMHCCASGGHHKRYFWCEKCGSLKDFDKETKIIKVEIYK